MSDDVWPKHLYALDFSRGLAALSVVLWHWQHFAYKGTSLSQGFIRAEQPLYDVLKIFYEKGAAGVDYFFLLSGFIFFWLYRESIYTKKINAKTFAIQRFSRLYPLHFVTLMIVALLQLFYITREDAPFVYPFNDVYHFILNLVFASHWGLENGWSFNAPVWSVSIEVLLYVVFFFVAFFRNSRLLLPLSITVMSFILFHFMHDLLFKGLTLFFLGGVVFHITFLISVKYLFFKIPVYLITITGWLCVIAEFYFFEVYDIIPHFGLLRNVIILDFKIYFLFSFTICSLALIEIDKGSFFKPLSWVGDITYASYLLHFPLQLIFGLTVSFGIINSGFYMNPVYLILYFTILVPLSYIVYIKFERPVQKAIRKKFLHT